MNSGTASPKKTTVVCFDRTWPMVEVVVRRFAEICRDADIHVVFLSEREPSSIRGNLEIVSIHDIPQEKSLQELQNSYSFSLHKALAVERSYYDYSSFRSSQRFSRLSEARIAELVTPYANAFDYLIRERADLILDWFPDCFIPAVAGRIAAHYGKPFRMFMQHYWWTDGGFLIDRMDLTSSDVDRNYHHFYAHPESCDRERAVNVFKVKKTLYAFSSSQMYSLAMRVRLSLNRLKSYEPPSVLNWIVRKTSRLWSRLMIQSLIPRITRPQGERFVLYPLHTSPEAALLGSSPELADQFGLIKNLSMNMPYGVKLYVKEHPLVDLGLGIGYDFYRRLNTLPNVRILRGDASLNEFLDLPEFLAVAVLTGTVGLDAAIKHKPVFVFGRPIYAAAHCFFKPSNFDEFHSQLLAIMRGEFKFNEPALYALLNALDASVVRADVDFLQCRDTPSLLMCFPPIWKRFVESRAWERVAGHEPLVGEPSKLRA